MARHPHPAGADAPPRWNTAPPNGPRQDTPPPDSSAKSQDSGAASPSAPGPGIRTRLGARPLVGAALVIIIIATASIYGATRRGSAQPTVRGVPLLRTTIPPSCGDGASVSLVGPSPIGRTFHDGESPSFSLDYTAPSCTRVHLASFEGYHSPGSPSYNRLCVELRPEWNYYCRSERLFSEFFIADEVALSPKGGTVTLPLIAANFTLRTPPPDTLFVLSPLSSASIFVDIHPLEGFILCHVLVRFADGGAIFNRDGSRGDGRYYDYEIGTSC